MNTTQFIAQIAGPFFGFIALSLLIAPQFYQKLLVEFRENTSALFLGSIFNIILGMVIILTHNDRTRDFSIIITILGRLSLLKGAILVLFPEQVIRRLSSRKLSKSQLAIDALICGILAILLLQLGFGI